jgi:predicted dehydrogenase
MGEQVNYLTRPTEDFANVTIEYESDDGTSLLGEASTSWTYVGAGLRLSMELLGPEYSMSVNSLDSGLKLFFSREVHGEAGEDLVEKQNAEVGLMPVVTDETIEYGYTAENRHMARMFSRGKTPEVTFADGVEVVELLMTAYMSAEQGRTLSFRPDNLDTFVPAVAKGTWKGRGKS